MNPCPPFVLIGICAALLAACGLRQCAPASDFTKEASEFRLDRERARSRLEFLTAAPHPFGSAAQARVAEFIESEVKKTGLTPMRQSFTASVPNPAIAADEDPGPRPLAIERQGQNILTAFALGDEASRCVVLLGSHYDTKTLGDTAYVGANDSGSTSVLLLELLDHSRALRGRLSLPCDLMAVWFDGEESVLNQWNDGERHPARLKDHTYGSRHLVASMQPCPGASQSKCLPAALGGQAVVALVLTDMLGSPNFKLTRESNSSPKLLKLLEEILQKLGLSERLSKHPKPIEDDHLPFREAGIPAIDLIDFEHLSVWHRPGDDADKISYESIELASKIAFAMGLKIAGNPKDFSD